MHIINYKVHNQCTFVDLQLFTLQTNESPSNDLKEAYQVYSDEYSLPPLNAINKAVIAEQLMFGYVIEKRERELVEIGEGLNSISLLTFLRANKVNLPELFPKEEERIINADVLKRKITEPSNQDSTFPLFMQYIDELGNKSPTG